MKLKVYTIRDAKAQIYNTPFFQRTHGEAERTFQELLRDPKSMVAKYPEDYHLHYIGDYDDQTGTLDAQDAPVHILAGSNVQLRPEADMHVKMRTERDNVTVPAQ